MRLLDREYAVAYKKTSSEDRIEKGTEFKLIANNFLSWTADPFPIEIDGELYIFAEVFLYTKAKGTIGYSKLTENGFTKWKIVLEEPYHLSFPNLFKKNGVIYMCPESHQDETLHLYRCVQFPDKWVKDKEIAKGDFNDTIYYEKDGLSYLLTYGLDDSFHIYKMDGCKLIDNDVSQHVEDINTSRPAGKIIKTEDGKEIMVTQIGKPVYGSGLVFKEFDVCWPEYYEKELFRLTAKDIKIDKTKNYIGLHTFNCSENYTVVDLIWEETIWQRIFFRILRKIKIVRCNNDNRKDFHKENK